MTVTTYWSAVTWPPAPVEAEPAPHITARIYCPKPVALDRMAQGVGHPGYVGSHRPRKAAPKPTPPPVTIEPTDKPGRIIIGALVGLFTAMAITGAVYGVQLFSVAW